MANGYELSDIHNLLEGLNIRVEAIIRVRV